MLIKLIAAVLLSAASLVWLNLEGNAGTKVAGVGFAITAGCMWYSYFAS